jgi:hypothetical protein
LRQLPGGSRATETVGGEALTAAIDTARRFVAAGIRRAELLGKSARFLGFGVG